MYYTIMKKTDIYTIRLFKYQKDTLTKLKEKYKVNVCQFIRQAITEKLDNDWDKITKEFKKENPPPSI